MFLGKVKNIVDLEHVEIMPLEKNHNDGKRCTIWCDE